ncbi:MAG: 50S ribosomal protein L11 methyltransferase [Vampirovibrionales bacterium]
MMTPLPTTTYELTFPLPTELCDWVCDILAGHDDVDSVQLRYTDDDPGLEAPYLVQVYSRYADIQDRILPSLEALPTVAPLLPTTDFRLAAIAEADWAEAWKQHWHVDTIVPDALTICPTWESYTPTHPEELVLQLDPGAAFGTGAHQTTRLMLQALHHEFVTGRIQHRSVIDLGCGSGILAIAAFCWGASHVTGMDIDPHAVRIAEANADLNKLPKGVATWTTDPLSTLPAASCDIMLVNILGPVIIELLPEIQRVLKPAGILWCSGLIESSCHELQTELEVRGFTLNAHKKQDRWVAVRALAPR